MSNDNKIGMQEAVALIALATLSTKREDVDNMILLAKKIYEENFAGYKTLAEFASCLSALIHIFSQNLNDATPDTFKQESNPNMVN